MAPFLFVDKADKSGPLPWIVVLSLVREAGVKPPAVRHRHNPSEILVGTVVSTQVVTSGVVVTTSEQTGTTAVLHCLTVVVVPGTVVQMFSVRSTFTARFSQM